MLIRFTQKLSKKLKIGSLAQIEDDPDPFIEWYANLFAAERVQYILTTESKSLLSLVFYGRGVTDDNIFIKHWLGSMREYFSEIGKSFVFEKIIGPRTGQFIYAKTSSKSILGSMNDMISMSKFMLPARSMSPHELSQMINETPFKAIKYQRPLDAFDKLKRIKLI
jgi:hypothetical protein